MKKFRGTYTVLITPFTADGRKVDEAALRRLVEETAAGLFSPAATERPVLAYYANAIAHLR